MALYRDIFLKKYLIRRKGQQNDVLVIIYAQISDKCSDKQSDNRLMFIHLGYLYILSRSMF